MFRAIVLLLLAFLMTGIVAAQPDRAEVLEKAKVKFEKDIKKSDDAIIALFDKNLAQAIKTSNKALQEKLNYERPLFMTQHLVPTAFPTDTYLRERSRLTNALKTTYQSAINELTKAKKFEEAAAIEDALNELLKSARGYGMPFPDIEANPDLVFQIEHKATGMVLDTEEADGRGKVVLSPVTKLGKSKPSQFWHFEREEKGFLIKNVKSKLFFMLPGGAGGTGEKGPTLATGNFNRKNETPSTFLFQVTSVRRDFIMEQTANDYALVPYEKMVKGVTTTYVSVEKKDPAAASQLWKLVEPK